MRGEGLAGAERLLVFGPIDLQYPIRPSERRGLVVVRLDTDSPSAPRATELLDLVASRSNSFMFLDADGTANSDWYALEAMPTWTGVVPHSRFVDILFDMSGALGAHIDIDNLAPLALLRRWSGNRSHVEVLAPSKLSGSHVVFTRVNVLGSPQDVPLQAAVPMSLGHVTKYASDLINEKAVYTKAERGVEIEVKINLGQGASIWHVASSLLKEIQQGGFESYELLTRDEFDRYQIRNQMFEVCEPLEERGYISFMKTAPAGYMIKRKIFPEDARRRIEKTKSNVGSFPSDHQLEGYLADEFPKLKCRRLPAFVRTRFDINLESLLSGHNFAVMVDECTVEGHPDEVLRQVELEYIRSREHYGLRFENIDDELDELTDRVERCLAVLGIPASRTLYSKLSFLRDVLERASSPSARNIPVTGGKDLDDS